MADGADSESSTWVRLRRRKLVQWALAYAAGAWVLLQVLGLLSATYAWPAAAMRVAVGIVAIGFVVALVLAWYHGERGAQRVGGAELAIITLLLAVGGAVVWQMESRGVSRSAVPATPAPAASTAAHAAPHPNSIAVLPFADMSQAKDQEYLSDGIAEELLNLLAKVRELRVTSRSSAFSFKGKDIDIPTIAKQLKVAHILEGSVRKSLDKVRITVQLIDVGSDTHVWSQTYDRPLGDIFAIQDEIAAAVVEQLKVTLLGAVPKAAVTDPAAYALYLQARQLHRQGTVESTGQAITRYEQALRIAPDYAAAWVGLATVYVYQSGRGLRPVDEAVALSRPAVEKALALEPDNAQALAARGWIALQYDLDLAAAADHAARALKLEPGSSDVLRTAGRVAISLDRPNLAIALSKVSLENDPANPVGSNNLCRAYMHAGREDEAIACYRNSLALSPDMVGVPHFIVMAMLIKGGDRAHAEAALATAQAERSESYRLIALALAQHAMGNRAASDEAIAELVSKYEASSAFNLAYIHAYRGEPDAAFAWLDKAVAYHDSGLSDIAVNRFFRPLHGDPRWPAFLTRLGFAPEQLAAIRFDVAVPATDPPVSGKR